MTFIDKINRMKNIFMKYDTLTDEIAAILAEGKTILYPTDTIWGLGCDATNEEAVKSIYNLKQRKKDKPFLILVDSLEMLKEYVVDLHPRIETLLHYHNRPLTIIHKQADNLPEISVANDKSVGIRITQDDFCKSIIRKLGKPVTSTSANISNNPPPAFFMEISEKVKSLVDYIVPIRQEDTTAKEPSVIAKYDEMGELIILRK